MAAVVAVVGDVEGDEFADPPVRHAAAVSEAAPSGLVTREFRSTGRSETTVPKR